MKVPVEAKSWEIIAREKNGGEISYLCCGRATTRSRFVQGQSCIMGRVASSWSHPYKPSITMYSMNQRKSRSMPNSHYANAKWSWLNCAPLYTEIKLQGYRTVLLLVLLWLNHNLRVVQGQSCINDCLASNWSYSYKQSITMYSMDQRNLRIMMNSHCELMLNSH